MEKFKTQEFKVGTNNVFFYSWRFTQDERNGLKKALAKFPAEKAKLFINDLELICLCARQYLKKHDTTFQRTERKRMLGRFKKAEEELYKLIDHYKEPGGEIPLKWKTSIRDDLAIFDLSIFSDSPSTSDASTAMVFENERLYYLVLAAATQLKEIISLIKDEPGKPGRPSVDVATGELIKIVAHGFQNYFERPTGHESSSKSVTKPSPFFPVVQVVLEACGLPTEDPDRHIRAALKSL